MNYVHSWALHPTIESSASPSVTSHDHYTNSQRDKTVVWTAECDQACNQLKCVLTSSPVLGYPRNDSEFLLDCDCSGYGMGAVLSQKQDGVERVISYFSKSLT